MNNLKQIKWTVMGSLLVLVTSLVIIHKKDVSPKPANSPIKKTAQVETPDDSAYQMVIRGRLAQVQACYNAELKKGLNKSGKLVVQWLVSPAGKASEFTEELNEMESSELYGCTTKAIASWPFPQNQTFMIRYTFNMHELGKHKERRQVAAAKPHSESSNEEPRDEVQAALGE